MAITDIEVVEAQIILMGPSLLNTAEEVSSFVEQARTEVVPEKVDGRLSPRGEVEFIKIFTLRKDRTRLHVSGSIFLAEMEYPSESSFERLAEIVGFVSTSTQLEDGVSIRTRYGIFLVVRSRFRNTYT